MPLIKKSSSSQPGEAFGETDDGIELDKQITNAAKLAQLRLLGAFSKYSLKSEQILVQIEQLVCSSEGPKYTLPSFVTLFASGEEDKRERRWIVSYTLVNIPPKFCSDLESNDAFLLNSLRRCFEYVHYIIYLSIRYLFFVFINPLVWHYSKLRDKDLQRTPWILQRKFNC